MAESTEHIIAAGFETGGALREPNTVQTNATINSTSPIAGTYDLKLDYTDVINGTPPFDHNIVCEVAFTGLDNYRNCSLVFKYKPTSTNGAAVALANIGSSGGVGVSSSLELYISFGQGVLYSSPLSL